MIDALFIALMQMLGKKRKRQEPKPDHHFEVDFRPSEREALLTWLQEDKLPSIAMRQRLEALLTNARRQPGEPLPVAQLDWSALAAEAERQGCSEADVFWDMARKAA